MTDNLEEFRRWLEEDPTRKGDITNEEWNNFFATASRMGFDRWIKEGRQNSWKFMPVVEQWIRESQGADQRTNELTQQNLQAQLTSLTNQKHDLQTQLQQKTTELNNKQTQLTQLQTQLNSKSSEVNQKQQQINSLQQQITNLQSQVNQKLQESNQKQTQITNLTSEKRALEERMLKEKSEALKEWEEEKSNWQKELTKLNEAKDTFKGSCEYLRAELKKTEKSLEEVKRELGKAQEQAQESEESYQRSLTEKSEELERRNEAFKVVSARNSDLQSKLSQASLEIDQLNEWIGKLEGASVEGDAFSNLKKELELSQKQIQELTELLNSKKGRSYWWVYVLVALVGVWLVVR